MKKLKAILVSVKKGIVILWREYKFIVPPILWHKYFLRLKQKYDYFRYSSVAYNPNHELEYDLWINQHEKEKKDIRYVDEITYLVYVTNITSIYFERCLESILVKHVDPSKIIIGLQSGFKLDESLIEKYNTLTYIHLDDNTRLSYLMVGKTDYLWIVNANTVLSKYSFPSIIQSVQTKDHDIIYFDSDLLSNLDKRHSPFFKNAYSPDVLLGMNYIGSNFICSKEILEIAEFDCIYTEQWMYSLILSMVESTSKIHHIEEIGFHQYDEKRDYGEIQQRKAIVEKSLNRKGVNASVNVIDDYTYVDYDHKNVLVSIIIPARDQACVTKRCLDSIYKHTTYQNFEIILVDNASSDAETFEMYKSFMERSNFRLIEYNHEFNYSKINNYGIKQANGDVIVLLNNDTEIITRNWLEILVGYAIQNHIGAVGAKLYYEDNTIQHGGIVLGVGGVAVHAFLHDTNNSIDGRLEIPYNYSAVTAACLAIEKRKIYEVGLLNESLKVAYNDVDLNLKLIDIGYFNVFHPLVEVYHLESKSRGADTTAKKYKLFLEEGKYMKTKWGEMLKHDPFYNDNYSRYSPDVCFQLKKYPFDK